MKRSKRASDEVSLFHILLGESDDDCDVCRAHGLNGHDLPEGIPGVLMAGTIDEFLHCPCPLCTQICKDKEPPLEDYGGDHRAACWHTKAEGIEAWKEEAAGVAKAMK